MNDLSQQHDSFTCDFSWRLDRDECGVCAEAELIQFPDWMSQEARRLIERDLASHVLSCHRNRRKVAA